MNSLLWGSEVAYLAILNGELTAADPDTLVFDHLGYLKAHAWHVGQNERRHYDRQRVGPFLRDLEDATRRVATAVLTTWLAHFEEYLDEVLGKKRGWGPYMTTLGQCDALHREPYKVRFERVLTADIWRETRNGLVHRPRVPVSAPANTNEIVHRLGQAKTIGGRWKDERGDILKFVKHETRTTLLGVRDRARKPQNPPSEVFCALYAFTAIDNLVHDIEEATLTNARRAGTIPLRVSVGLRNRDLLASNHTA